MNIRFLQKVRASLWVAVTALMLSIAAIFAYSNLIEKPFLSYKNLPFPVDQKVVQGQTAMAVGTRCNSSDQVERYTSKRQLKRENSSQPTLFLPDMEVSVEPGCHPVQTRSNVIPDDLPPGFYRFMGTATVHGLIKDHVVAWNTDVFEVLAKPTTQPKDTP